ncbi:MAG: Mu transposase C-terminal domain-containing protein [Methylovirgula sp.]|uniref:Mu transposase C-terminal domain-containing protein n=1 Tax=Methylovirgula sp. TaxID=1978224 RepID=UPI003076871F
MSTPRPHKLRFSHFDRIVIADKDYRYVEAVTDGYLFRRNDTDLVETFSRDQIAQLRLEKKFGVDRDFYSIEKARARGESDLQFLKDLPLEKQNLILCRKDCVDAFLELEKTDPSVTRSDAAMPAAIDRIIVTLQPKWAVMMAQERKPRTGTIAKTFDPPRGAKAWRTWLTRYENSGGDARALHPRYHQCGDRTPKVAAETRPIMNKHVHSYMDERRPSKRKCFTGFLQAIKDINEQRRIADLEPIPTVSKNTFFAAIDRLSKFHVYAARYTLEAAKRKFHMSSGGIEARRPLERVETDEWHIHLHTLFDELDLIQYLEPDEIARLKRCRWHLCIVIDCATRCILGASIAATATPENALRALHLACIDKTKIAIAAGAVTPWDMHGTPDCVSADNGSSFVSTKYRIAVSDLGSNPDYPPAGFPELRPKVERFIRTIDTKAASDFTGRTFSNIVELGDYPAEQRAAITVEELWDVFLRYLVDEYHNEPHDGLFGETPRNAWLRLTEDYGASPPPTANMLRVTFGTALTRTIGDYGIRVLGLWYQSEELQTWRRQYGDVKIDIRVDPEDLGAISTKLGNSWIPINCLADWASGLDVRTWIGVCADLRARFAREAEVASHVVHDAVCARQALSQKAIKRAALGPTTLSSEEIELAERNLTLSFRWKANVPDPSIDADRDPLHDATMPVATAAPSVPPTAAAPELNNPPVKNYQIED